MGLEELLGYTGALFIGVIIGLLGGGGSILTVPLLVYLLQYNPVTATAYSLFVVGVSSLVGTVQKQRKGLVDFKTGLAFCFPSFMAVYLSRRYLVPFLPDIIVELPGYTVTKDMLIMVFFASIMFLASMSMIRDRKGNPNTYKNEKQPYYKTFIQGMVIGFITGFIGAGGGFLYVPALALWARLPMKTAVGTSLVIVTINSLVGFSGDVQTLDINWQFLLSFSAFTITGTLIGGKLSHLVPGKTLKKGFGILILLMSIFIISKEVITKETNLDTPPQNGKLLSLKKLNAMKIEQIYTGCLAQGAYYIESDGEAAIIDPLRETQPYIDRAKKEGATIKYVFETHFHADFVSGHIDLAEKTGATIVYGPKAATSYDIYSAKDGEEFKIGKVTIKVLHTPGHTLESTTYLLIDEHGNHHAIFTGDTLFLGDVGRPDLAIKQDITKEDLAGMLYDSLREKIMPLEDDVIVYPAHGAGSACGKNLSKETVDLLGNQKKTNYALREDMSKEDFVAEVLDGILPPPQYFAKNAMMNKEGYQSFETILEKGNVPLGAEAFEAMANHESALVLDVRTQEEFVKEHIPNSIFIGLNGSFAPWVGALIKDLNQPIILVVPEGKSEEAVTRLSRVGYDNTLGYLEGGMNAWKAAGKETAKIRSISAEELEKEYNGEITVLDVRKPGEYSSEHLENAVSFPLDFINEEMNSVDRDKPYYVHCAGGYRSVIAASILKARGFEHLTDIAGGYKALKETGMKRTDYVCPSTLK